MSDSIQRVTICKNAQVWRFRWERGGEAGLLATASDWARNGELDFDWFDAAHVAQHILGKINAQPT